MRTTRRSGFTLIELQIVVVIIGILAAIALPKFASLKNRAFVVAMKTDLRSLMSAEEAFFADSVKYTSNVAQLFYRQSTGVVSPQILAGPGYFSATVTHTQIQNPLVICGIGINTPNPVLSTAGEGEPVCK